MVLEKINQPNDIKKLEKSELPVLAEEIRSFLIEKISVTGGHLASNLGVVELTMALHLAFELPEDKIIWDVGHQSYTHKLLTGRREGFDDLRKYGGMSGFPKREESPCDAFDTGHSSTSISAGLGYARARDLQGEKYSVISVIGDGSLTGGMAYEALNNAAQLKSNFIIVLNDNEMSISNNVGGVSTYLSSIRTADAYLELKSGVENTLKNIPLGDRMVERIRGAKNSLKQMMIPGMYFEDMGLKYLGPVDGSNVSQMVRVFNEAKRVAGPVVIHIKTVKGKGYAPAQKHPARFHGTGPFDIETGLPKSGPGKATWTDVFSTVMCKLGKQNEKMVAVTAAMPDGTGLKRFRNMYPDRFFDVGIAEQHGVTFCAGLAVGGLTPVFAVYSSFLQRAYDQLIHDVCLQQLHVVFAVDRAGLVGADGETHQGIFDLSFLSTIPNMTVMAPKNKWELADMLKYAVKEHNGPIAIRYGRGQAYDGLEEFRAPVRYGKSEILYDEREIALIAAGSMVKTAEEVRAKLRDMGYSCSLINARFVKPIDEDMLARTLRDHRLIVTMEENVRCGGFGDHVLEYISDTCSECKVINITLPDDYIEHGNVDLLREETATDAASILKKILAVYVGMNPQ